MQCCGWALRAGLVIALLLLAGCACYGHRLHRGGEQARVELSDGRDTLHFVEADDEGWFWSPAQADAALAEIDASARERDTFVLLFVHGWHHSAACCDGNIEGFKDVVRKLREELSQPMYAAARNKLDKSGQDFRIIAVYVGWRGGSLPGLADYATFWGRKAAAERVGRGDLHEFMQRLARRYDEQKPAADSSKSPLLGLVTIGHSFGGQVVLSAVASLLESRLIEAGAPTAWLRDGPRNGAPVQATAELRGFGDLVLLVNPAVEAAAYQRIHALGMGMAYDPRQTPLLLTLSADDDRPRGRYFPLGRRAGEVFARKPRKDNAFEREAERKSLGFFTAQRTHCLAAVDPARMLHKQQEQGHPEATCPAGGRCRFDTYDWPAGTVQRENDTLSANDANPETLARIACHDLSTRSVFGDVVLQPQAQAQPHQAFIVASAHRSVLTTHNGMFSRPLTRFLTRYVGFIEAKRFMPLVMNHPTCPSPDPGVRHAQADLCRVVE